MIKPLPVGFGNRDIHFTEYDAISFHCLYLIQINDERRCIPIVNLPEKEHSTTV